MDYHIEQLKEAVEFFTTPYADDEDEQSVSEADLGQLITITATLMDYLAGLLQERERN
jgi:hypothetical protein